MVFQDDSKMIVEAKSTAKLACPDPESSSDLEQCCSPSCVHCDANLFKMIKSEIKSLTNESDLLKYSSTDSSQMPSFTAPFPFETQRSRFYTIVDEWRTDRMEHISFIYQKKRNQIDFICSQTWHEFEIFKIEQNTLSHGNLLLKQPPTTDSKIIPTITIPNEIEQLNQKLSLTRHLLDYFIQPHLNHHHSLSDDDEDDDDHNLNGNDYSDESSDDRTSSVNYEDIFLEKPMQEFPLCTDNLAMASSNSHLLLRDGARLLLFNEREKLHQLEIKVQHPGDFIRDLCWCEALGYYLVLTQYLLFIYDPDKFTLTIIDKVKPIERLKFSSLTCSDNIMFLVNGNGQCIERWLIGKNFQWKLIKRKRRSIEGERSSLKTSDRLGWPENEFCHENFRLTSRIRANHLVLGKSRRMLSTFVYLYVSIIRSFEHM